MIATLGMGWPAVQIEWADISTAHSLVVIDTNPRAKLYVSYVVCTERHGAIWMRL